MIKIPLFNDKGNINHRTLISLITNEYIINLGYKIEDNNDSLMVFYKNNFIFKYELIDGNELDLFLDKMDSHQNVIDRKNKLNKI